MLCIKVPDGLDPRHAALTEPMAVGLHAVAKSGIKPGEAALVLGCGPVGLAVIAALKIAGIETIVAADFSPGRRALARTMGAHEVVDPREETAIAAWQRVDGQRPLVIYEAVGVTGMLDQAMRDAPRLARILVVGVCMETDTIWPMLGINKELNIQFVLGYTPEEFRTTLDHIASGAIDVVPLITGEVGIAGVPDAFRMLASPDVHAKILVEPALG
jgi:threonine dehydrogenase-like Zn-dependent dehydrogenase